MGDQPEGVKVTDKRKVDPETGQPRDGSPSSGETEVAVEAQAEVIDIPLDAAGSQVRELTETLQRLQAEFSNYKKRVDRDRLADREVAVASTLVELLPILDNIGRARASDELVGAFKTMGEALESTVVRLGMTPFGAPGDPFDPARHEGLLSEPRADVEADTCAEIALLGYEFRGRVVRPAQVIVATPIDATAQA